jgi:hypothetical protein
MDFVASGKAVAFARTVALGIGVAPLSDL